MRQLLKQIPGAAKMVRDARYLTMLARERWFTDRRIMNDNSHLLHEWDFGSLTNQDRYMRLLALVKNLKGTAHWGDVLEIGCSEGLFTALLAANCQTLTACDISQVACERTALSLSKCSNLRVKTMDLDFDPIVGSFDLVFAMDVLEFIHGRDRLAQVGRKLAEALRPGGILIVSACRLSQELRRCWWSWSFPEGADNIIEFLSSRFGLVLSHSENHSAPDDEAYIEHLLAVFGRPQLS